MKVKRFNHRNVSFVKSAIRIVGYYSLASSTLWAALFLLLAELVGIIEELV